MDTPIAIEAPAPERWENVILQVSRSVPGDRFGEVSALRVLPADPGRIRPVEETGSVSPERDRRSPLLSELLMHIVARLLLVFLSRGVKGLFAG